MNDITSENYSFVDSQQIEQQGDDAEEFTEIRIHGDHGWNGVQFKFGKVGVSEPINDTDEHAKLSFDFHVTNLETYNAYNLERDPGFQQYVGDILVHIIESAFAEGEYRIGSNRDDNSEESASQ